MSNARGSPDQSTQLPSRSRNRKPLKCGAAREHDGDNRAREVLAKRERTGHRENGNQIYAHLALKKLPPARDSGCDKNEAGRCAEQPPRPLLGIERIGETPARKPRN